jgi:hypothetical protein
MNSDDLRQAFADCDPSGLPDLAELDDRRRMLWVLRVGKEKVGRDAMTAAEIADVLRDVYGFYVPRQRVTATLDAEQGTVARRRISGRRVYQLMAAGSAELDAGGHGVTFIDPTNGYSGLRAVHATLAEVGGSLRVCDPYTDTKTLDMLGECGRPDAIRLLTRNIQRPDGLKQAAKAFEREHDVPLQVKRAPAGVLHDRYLIHDRGMLVFGTSLNGLGLKQSFVISLGSDMRAAALAAFEAMWDQSEAFWPPSS